MSWHPIDIARDSIEDMDDGEAKRSLLQLIEIIKGQSRQIRKLERSREAEEADYNTERLRRGDRMKRA